MQSMNDRTCTFESCTKPHLAKGLCSGHWHQQRRGVPLKPLRPGKGAPMSERLLFHVEKRDEHWIWTGTHNQKGYGLIKIRGKNSTTMAHRVSYETFVGPIPDGKEIDHTCRVRDCIRPEHLEAVTHVVNIRRGIAARKALRGMHV